ncbi:MAG: DsbA family protein [Sphingomonas sp.]|nr:DsbA family protein [Sphingomonas sp.]
MSLARRLATRGFTSPALRDARRLGHRLARLARGGARRATFFWQVDDPYAAVALPYLAALAARHGLAVRVMLVPAPDAGAAPEPEKLAVHARVDAARLAAALGLPPVALAPLPEPLRAEAERAALALIAGHAPLAELARFAQSFAAGQLPPGPRAEPAETRAALVAGAEARARAGHYLGSVTWFEGEHYWGVDRLHYLEARLGGAGLCPRLDPVLPGAARPASGVPLDFYLSFRSPYTLVAAERIGALADHYGAALRLRFVLPMVMRGLPVPAAKRGYITLDTKREASRHGIGFGTIVDPVGTGVERGLAVLDAVIARDGDHAGLAFARAFLRAAFAQGIDMTGAGLIRVAARVGLDRGFIEAALAETGWRERAEANRAALFARGLWGVPSFQVADRPALWGQDRLWAVEDDLRAELGLSPIDRRLPCAG